MRRTLMVFLGIFLGCCLVLTAQDLLPVPNADEWSAISSDEGGMDTGVNLPDGSFADVHIPAEFCAEGATASGNLVRYFAALNVHVYRRDALIKRRECRELMRHILGGDESKKKMIRARQALKKIVNQP